MSMTSTDILTAVLATGAGAIMIFAEPTHSTLQKWAYWCIGPLLGTAAAAVAFNDVGGGLGFGLLILCVFGMGYLRYKDHG